MCKVDNQIYSIKPSKNLEELGRKGKIMVKTVKELLQMYEDNKLHTNQSTQRGFIYEDITTINPEGEEISKAGDVVKSILERNIKLPALYFWRVEDANADIFYDEDEYNIHDGKQRFLSILNFIGGDQSVVTSLKGRESKWDDLPRDMQNKLLDYEFDVVVRVGTLKEEEESFLLINTSGENLTTYEALRGAYHGKYTYEFENYLKNFSIGHDKIRNIGRGEQACWLLYTALGIINEDRKNLLAEAKKRLDLCRNSSFDKTVGHFDVKLDFYNRMLKIGLNGENADKTPHKVLRIVDYVVESNYDKNTVEIYYIEGLKSKNDIKKWKFETHRTALDNLCKKGIKCDFRRFFNESEKLQLWEKSHRCAKCNDQFDFRDLEVDHINPWSKGGKTTLENAQLLCKSCNTSKRDR